MLQLPKIIRKTLSVRISLMVVFAMGMLLIASMVVMLHYSRKAIKEEALQKASQTLEGTVQRIDNIMLSVEQASGNIYFSLLPHLDRQDKVYEYCRKLVETSPYIQGCAIAMKEDFYKDHQFFMAYYHRKPGKDNHYTNELIQSDTFGDTPYTQQLWYTQPMETGRAGWINPLSDVKVDVEPLITFSLPIYNAPFDSLQKGNVKPVGVIGVDVALSVLSDIVEEAKFSDYSYCTLLNADGEYIIHPDDNKLMMQTDKALKDEEDTSAKEAVQAMMAGGTGYRPFRLNGTDYYVFYKSFERTSVPGRTMEKLGWSAGIVYPEDDIFGDYNRLLYYVLGITIACLLLMFLLSRTIVHHQLKPLLMLTKKAQRISQGHYDEPIPVSNQMDEIGQLQDNFKLMQERLSAYIGELEQLTDTLRERGEGLSQAYEEAQKADRMKTAFLHNMTNQMTEPSLSIDRDVNSLLEGGDNVVDNIQMNGKRITDLLNNLLNMSDEEKTTA